MTYVLLAIVAFVIAAVLTPIVRRFAVVTGCIDVPRPPRNLHKNPVAKLGGLAVFFSFAVVVLLYVVFGSYDHAVIPMKFVWAVLGGSAVLAIGGFLDDKFNLPPSVLWIFPALASLVVILSGIGVGITSISNPVGSGTINIDYAFFGIPASAIFIFIWLNGMMYTTKFLDGLDGLVGGVGMIAGFTLFALSLTDKVNQPITASLAIIFVGALAGYMLYAFNPATIFFGEGGSTFVGFILGVLSVILGGKIATALLVMGIPILDVAWVILQRLWQRKSPFVGDRLHIHFKLLDLGFTQKQTVFILYALSAMFGFTAIFLQSRGKLFALITLFIVMCAFVLGLLYAYRRKR